MNTNTRTFRFGGIEFLVALAAALTVAGTLTPQKGNAQNQSGGSPQIGEFRVNNFAVWDTSLSGDAITANLTGPNLQIRSPQYEMAAPRIQMTARKSGKPVRYRASKASASGGVRIVVRQPDAQRTNVVTCDNAFYTAAAAPNTGRIDLKGNVRLVVQDPALAGPSEVTGDTGRIEMLGPNQTNIVINNGSAAATLIEPKPKKQGGK